MTTLELTRWLNPWPISLGGLRKRSPNARWTFSVEPLWRAGKYRRFDGIESVAYMVRRLKRSIDNDLPDTSGRGHYIEMLARDLIPTMRTLTIIVNKKSGYLRVIDGNHRLAALLLARMQGKPTLIKYVGVVRQR